jgi:hypothetical protein
MRSSLEMIVLVLGIAMIVPTPIDEIIGGFGRLALAVLGFLIIARWLIWNDQREHPQG